MIRIGRLVVDESEIRNINENVGSISFDGIESVANQSVMSVKRKQQDIVASTGMMVPVTFDHKPDYDGYYVVESAEAVLTNWHRQAVAACEWDLSLLSVGSYNDIDLESRLGGPVTLPNVHGGTGERWHAPPPGHTAYWSASSAPTSITRTGSEGPIKVYRNVSDAVNTRWNCPPNLYPIGRARFTDANGFERTGASYKLTPTGWTISNSLMRVGAVPGSAHLMIEAFTNGNWRPQLWEVQYNGVSLGTPKSVSIQRNDFELVQVRILWDVTPSGRVTADLTLRRGSRFVEVLVKSMLGATLTIRPTSGVASASSTGYMTATANDPSGNRYTAGSPVALTGDPTNGGFSKAATQVLDAYIGVVAGGGSAVAGDTAADIFKQFLGAPTERVLGVRI